MLSEHELTLKVRDDLYPRIREVESDSLDLFNMQFIPGRGPTGVTSSNELGMSVELLRSAAAMLERIGKEKGIL